MRAGWHPSHLFFLAFALLATALVVADRQVAASLWYSRRAILEGELWRLVTSNIRIAQSAPS